MLSKISQTDQDKYHIISLNIESKNQMNKQNKQTNKKQKQTHKYREQTDGCQSGEEWENGQNK